MGSTLGSPYFGKLPYASRVVRRESKRYVDCLKLCQGWELFVVSISFSAGLRFKGRSGVVCSFGFFFRNLISVIMRKLLYSYYLPIF